MCNGNTQKAAGPPTSNFSYTSNMFPISVVSVPSLITWVVLQWTCLTLFFDFLPQASWSICFSLRLVRTIHQKRSPSRMDFPLMVSNIIISNCKCFVLPINFCSQQHCVFTSTRKNIFFKSILWIYPHETALCWLASLKVHRSGVARFFDPFQVVGYPIIYTFITLVFVGPVYPLLKGSWKPGSGKNSGGPP